jgi:hypothetical protein
MSTDFNGHTRVGYERNAEIRNRIFQTTYEIENNQQHCLQLEQPYSFQAKKNAKAGTGIKSGRVMRYRMSENAEVQVHEVGLRTGNYV